MKERPLSWAPDADPTTPGVLLDGDMFYPTLRGIRSYPTAQAIGTALPANAASAWARQVVDAQFDMQLDLYVSSIFGYIYNWNGAWQDVSSAFPRRVSDWTAFGDVVICSSTTNPLRVRVGTAAFVDIPNTPAAQIVFNAGGFVFAASTSPSGNDAWAHCNTFDYATWVRADTNNANSGNLWSPGGIITAGEALGDIPVLYKRNAIYLGSVLPDRSTVWPQVPGSVGCVGKDALVVAEGAHWFMGEDDFYRFDGSVPQPIGADIREYVIRHTDPADRPNASALFDSVRKCITWQIGTLGVVYSIPTGTWGRADYADKDAQATTVYVRGLGKLPVQRGSISNQLVGNNWHPGIMIIRNDQLYANTGFDQSWVETGDFGDDDKESGITRVRARYSLPPVTANLTHYYRNSFSTDPTAVFVEAQLRDNTYFDFSKQARWHRDRIDMTGDWELLMLDRSAPSLGKGK